MQFKRFAVIGFLAAALAGTAATGHAQNQLLLNGTFDTLPALAAGTYSSSVGRSGSGAAIILNGTTGTGGWFTNESDGLFEIWTAGYLGSPTTVGNMLELANDAQGDTIEQSASTDAAGGTTATLAFGYIARNSGKNAFTASVLDLTTGTTVFTQAFNPTTPINTNNLFSTTFAITAGDTLQVAFLDQNTVTGGQQSAHIDNVGLTQNAVPEPSAVILVLAMALVGTMIVRRRLALLNHNPTVECVDLPTPAPPGRF